MPIFKGAGVAIVTPMKDNLEVDYDALETNINYQIDNGTDAIVIAGTTGESATLSVKCDRYSAVFGIVIECFLLDRKSVV